LRPVDNIALKEYIDSMQWTLIYHNEFIAWLDSQPENLQDEAQRKDINCFWTMRMR
jgi:hypothetical protein